MYQYIVFSSQPLTHKPSRRSLLNGKTKSQSVWTTLCRHHRVPHVQVDLMPAAYYILSVGKHLHCTVWLQWGVDEYHDPIAYMIQWNHSIRTPLNWGHLHKQDTFLSPKYALHNPWNEDTSLLRTFYSVSGLERFHCIHYHHTITWSHS